MIRFISTALVILGLIIQPFAAATASPMADHGMGGVVTFVDASYDVNMDERQHNMKMAGSDSSTPCELQISQDSTEISCDDCCGMDCTMVSRCASSCAAFSFVTIQQSSILANPREQKLLPSSTTAQLHGRASLIFHPPKHS